MELSSYHKGLLDLGGLHPICVGLALAHKIKDASEVKALRQMAYLKMLEK